MCLWCRCVRCAKSNLNNVLINSGKSDDDYTINYKMMFFSNKIDAVSVLAVGWREYFGKQYLSLIREKHIHD